MNRREIELRLSKASSDAKFAFLKISINENLVHKLQTKLIKSSILYECLWNILQEKQPKLNNIFKFGLKIAYSRNEISDMIKQQRRNLSFLVLIYETIITYSKKVLYDHNSIILNQIE